MNIIGDIGGTHMRIAASDIPYSFEEPVVIPTPESPTEAAQALKDAIAKVAKGRSVHHAIIGIAGLLSPDNTTLLTSPHLRSWEDEAIADIFNHAIDARVYLKNDAMLGALGEAHFGAGQDTSVLAYITVGTGVGGARIVHGRIDYAVRGFEIGHQRLGTTPEAPELEALISGSGMEAHYGKPAAEIHDKEAWNTAADQLAIGLYNTILHWSPERVVLGGSAFHADEVIPLARVKETLAKVNVSLETLPDIQLAKLGDQSGLYGALILARDH